MMMSRTKTKLISFFIICYVLIAILGSFIANDKPFYCKNNEGSSFPVLSKKTWNDQGCISQINTIIPYSFRSIDHNNRKVSPFGKQQTSSFLDRHWFGTDMIGRDVLAGLINGAKISLWVGFFSLALALSIGFLFGFISGILGDDSIKVHWTQILFFLLSICVLIFYWIYSSWRFAFVISLAIIALYLLISKLIPEQKKKIYLPLDWIIMRAIEVFKSIPSLFLVLFLVTMFNKPSYWNIILIIGISAWPQITRLLRAELLRIKSSDYYAAAVATGQSPFKVFLNHGLPNAIQPIKVSLAFAFAATVLLESSLSFLGIGVPADIVTWGSMLNEARINFNMWWMALFPGLAIFGTVILFNALGDQFKD